MKTHVTRFGLAAAALVAGAAVAALLLGGPTSTKAQAAAPQTTGQLVIDGETLPVLSFSAGVSNAFGGGGGGGGAGKASFSSFNLMTPTGATAPVLLHAVASGKHFPTAVFTGTWGSGSSTVTFTYELEDVVIESYQQSGSSELPSDSLSLAFQKVKWTYTDAAGAVTRGWDVEANASIP